MNSATSRDSISCFLRHSNTTSSARLRRILARFERPGRYEPRRRPDSPCRSPSSCPYTPGSRRPVTEGGAASRIRFVVALSSLESADRIEPCLHGVPYGLIHNSKTRGFDGDLLGLPARTRDALPGVASMALLVPKQAIHIRTICAPPGDRTTCRLLEHTGALASHIRRSTCETGPYGWRSSRRATLSKNQLALVAIAVPRNTAFHWCRHCLQSSSHRSADWPLPEEKNE